VVVVFYIYFVFRERLGLFSLISEGVQLSSSVVIISRNRINVNMDWREDLYVMCENRATRRNIVPQLGLESP